MNSSCRTLVVALAALSMSTVTPPAQARNDKLLQPIRPMMNQLRKNELLDPKISFHFGAAVPAGFEIVNAHVQAHGVADPQPDRSRNVYRPDNVVCNMAFRQALIELAQKARESGGTALVGVVSNYQNVEMDSVDVFECHAGYTRAVVDLKAKVARRVPVQASTAAPATPQPADESEPVPQAHVKRVPAPTGYAQVTDIDAVPLSSKGKARYQHYLTLPAPKAFVIYLDGGWRFFSKDGDAMTKALDFCAREGKPCWLYAVDDAVVWSETVAQRIGKSSQLAHQP